MMAWGKGDNDESGQGWTTGRSERNASRADGSWQRMTRATFHPGAGTSDGRHWRFEFCPLDYFRKFLMEERGLRFC